MSIEVKIGVTQHPHEIDIEIDSNLDEFIATIEDAIDKEKPMIWVTSSKGNKVGVPALKIAFIEVRSTDEAKRVGFGA